MALSERLLGLLIRLASPKRSLLERAAGEGSKSEECSY
jgi:hypothetical protein